LNVGKGTEDNKIKPFDGNESKPVTVETELVDNENQNN
jgi:hypothetical protein